MIDRVYELLREAYLRSGSDTTRVSNYSCLILPVTGVSSRPSHQQKFITGIPRVRCAQPNDNYVIALLFLRRTWEGKETHRELGVPRFHRAS